MLPAREKVGGFDLCVSAFTWNTVPLGLCRGSPRSVGRHLVWRTDAKNEKEHPLLPTIF